MRQRSISNEFMSRLLSDYKALIDYVKTDDTLDLEMRGDKVIVYYRGGKILSLSETGALTPLDKQYGEGLTLAWSNLDDYIPKAKHLIDVYQTSTKASLGEKRNFAANRTRKQLFTI